MPIDLQIIRASEFIRLDPHQQLDFEASKLVLRALAQACRKRGLDQALVDLRTLPVPDKPRFTTKEIAALVSAFRDAGFSRRQRLAILYRHDVYGGVRNFAFFSRMRGLDVHAFIDFEEAFNWLSEDREVRGEESRDEVSVPITRPKTRRKLLPVSKGK
jgi:hypothetical protein